MKNQMWMTTLSLTAGAVLLMTGCQTKQEASLLRSQQEAIDMAASEEDKTEGLITTPAAELTPATPVEQPSDITPAPAPTRPQLVVYTVTAGDSVSALSTRFNVRQADIVALNPALREHKNSLKIGQKLNFPAGTDVTKKAIKRTAAPQKTATTATAGKVYTVCAGDVLGGIATRHGVTVAEIKKLNHLKKDTIFVGQKLTLPATAKMAKVATAKPATKPVAQKKPVVAAAKPVAKDPSIVPPPVEEPTPVDNGVPPPPAEEEVVAPVVETPDTTADAVPPPPPAPATEMRDYVVQPNEDLLAISLRWGVELNALRAANNLPETTKSVDAGTVLHIPVVAE